MDMPQGFHLFTGSRTAVLRSPPEQLPLWRLNVLRVGYFVVGVGLAVTGWPLLLDHDSWELKEGTVVSMLVTMSVLALLGLRYPTRMLPILLFEGGWKLIWPPRCYGCSSSSPSSRGAMWSTST